MKSHPRRQHFVTFQAALSHGGAHRFLDFALRRDADFLEKLSYAGIERVLVHDCLPPDMRVSRPTAVNRQEYQLRLCRAALQSSSGFRPALMISAAAAMSELSLTILPETADDALAIERLHERTFGPGRYARTAYRLREAVPHRLELSFTARIGTLLVGSVRLSH